jgi:hypothetical protein
VLLQVANIELPRTWQFHPVPPEMQSDSFRKKRREPGRSVLHSVSDKVDGDPVAKTLVLCLVIMGHGGGESTDGKISFS